MLNYSVAELRIIIKYILSSILCFLRLWTQYDHNLKTLKIQISHNALIARSNEIIIIERVCHKPHPIRPGLVVAFDQCGQGFIRNLR